MARKKKSADTGADAVALIYGYDFARDGLLSDEGMPPLDVIVAHDGSYPAYVTAVYARAGGVAAPGVIALGTLVSPQIAEVVAEACVRHLVAMQERSRGEAWWRSYFNHWIAAINIAWRQIRATPPPWRLTEAFQRVPFHDAYKLYVLDTKLANQRSVAGGKKWFDGDPASVAQDAILQTATVVHRYVNSRRHDGTYEPPQAFRTAVSAAIMRSHVRDYDAGERAVEALTRKVRRLAPPSAVRVLLDRAERDRSRRNPRSKGRRGASP